MIGYLYIDGVDVYNAYKIFVSEGGYNSLVAYPPMKSIDTNDWPEENGVEADLENPVLSVKEVTLSFLSRNSSRINDFVAKITDGAYHVFDFARIGYVTTLRLVSEQSRTTVQNMTLFKLQFSDDNPPVFDANYIYIPPITIPMINQTEYHLDGKPFSYWGIAVLNGTDDNASKLPPVKQNLLVTNCLMSGAQYDDHWVHFQSQDIAIKCYLHADVLIFWRNYNAFLYDLAKKGNRIFSTDKYGSFQCYYKSCTVDRFSLIDRKIWCEFTITLTRI